MKCDINESKMTKLEKLYAEMEVTFSRNYVKIGNYLKWVSPSPEDTRKTDQLHKKIDEEMQVQKLRDPYDSDSAEEDENNDDDDFSVYRNSCSHDVFFTVQQCTKTLMAHITDKDSKIYKSLCNLYGMIEVRHATIFTHREKNGDNFSQKEIDEFYKELCSIGNGLIPLVCYYASCISPPDPNDWIILGQQHSLSSIGYARLKETYHNDEEFRDSFMTRWKNIMQVL